MSKYRPLSSGAVIAPMVEIWWTVASVLALSATNAFYILVLTPGKQLMLFSDAPTAISSLRIETDHTS